MRQFHQECEKWDHKLCEVYPLRKGAEQFEHLIGNRLAIGTREPFMKAELIPYLLLHTSSLSLKYIYVYIYVLPLSLIYIYICLHFSTYRLFIQSFRPFRHYCLCPIPYPLFRPSPPIAYSLFKLLTLLTVTYFLSLYIYIYKSLDFSIYPLFIHSFFISPLLPMPYSLSPIPPFPTIAYSLFTITYVLSLSIYI